MTRPAPRCIRAFTLLAINRAPVTAEMRPASSNPLLKSAGPVISITVGSPFLKTFAICSTVASLITLGFGAD
jgi:hypothetical protein